MLLRQQHCLLLCVRQYQKRLQQRFQQQQQQQQQFSSVIINTRNRNSIIPSVIDKYNKETTVRMMKGINTSTSTRMCCIQKCPSSTTSTSTSTSTSSSNQNKHKHNNIQLRRIQLDDINNNNKEELIKELHKLAQDTFYDTFVDTCTVDDMNQYLNQLSIEQIKYNVSLPNSYYVVAYIPSSTTTRYKTTMDADDTTTTTDGSNSVTTQATTTTNIQPTTTDQLVGYLHCVINDSTTFCSMIDDDNNTNDDFDIIDDTCTNNNNNNFHTLLQKKYNYTKTIELKRIYIQKQFIGFGNGQLLMDWFLELVAQEEKQQQQTNHTTNNQQCTTIAYLGVWEHNNRAIQFYNKNHFTFSGYTHDFPIGITPQTDLWYWRKKTTILKQK